MKGLIFTYALTYGGALISLANPFYGLLIYFCFAIIKPESMWYWSVPAGNYSRIVAIALLVGWVFHGGGSWDFGRAKPFVYCLLFCWFWWCVSAALAPEKTRAWRSVEAQTKIFLPCLVGMTIIRSERQLKTLAWVLMLSQAYVALELNRAYFGGFNRLTVAGFGGMDNNCVSIAMVTGSGLAFFLGLNDEKLWRKLLCFGAAASMAHVPMFGFSRGGMLGLIVMGIVAFFLVPRQPRHYVIFLIALAVGLRLAGPEVMQRFSSTFTDAEQRDESAQSRLDMWKICVGMTKQSPVVGVGPNHFPVFVASHGFPYGKEAHTLWLQQFAELGIPGGLSLIGIFALPVLGLWKHKDDAQPNQSCDTIARMVACSLAGFAVSAMFVSLESLELPYYIAMLGAATLVVSDQEFESEQNRRRDPISSETLETVV